MGPITINATSPTVRELPSSKRRHRSSVSVDRSGAIKTKTIGATMIVIDAMRVDDEREGVSAADRHASYVHGRNRIFGLKPAAPCT